MELVARAELGLAHRSNLAQHSRLTRPVGSIFVCQRSAYAFTNTANHKCDWFKTHCDIGLISAGSLWLCVLVLTGTMAGSNFNDLCFYLPERSSDRPAIAPLSILRAEQSPLREVRPFSIWAGGVSLACAFRYRFADNTKFVWACQGVIPVS